MKRRVTIITTGGTIEKTYDERTGALENRRSILSLMLRRLRLVDTSVNVIELMSKDSQLMTDTDREKILAITKAAADNDEHANEPHGVVILHGTDTLSLTGELLHARLQPPPAPVALTGAFRPYEMRRSDALQNLNEAIFAVGVLDPGVYCVMHGRALAFPGVVKDREHSTFRKKDESLAD